MPREDRDIADKIKEVFENKNIEIISGAKVTGIAGGNVALKVYEKEDIVFGDAILIATGRKPNIKEL